jgi:hypothetical protein
MAQDHWPPGSDIIHILLSFGIIYIGTVCRTDKNRVSAYGLKGPYRRINASGDEPFGFFEKWFRHESSLHFFVLFSTSEDAWEIEFQFGHLK